MYAVRVMSAPHLEAALLVKDSGTICGRPGEHTVEGRAIGLARAPWSSPMLLKGYKKRKHAQNDPQSICPHAPALIRALSWETMHGWAHVWEDHGWAASPMFTSPTEPCGQEEKSSERGAKE